MPFIMIFLQLLSHSRVSQPPTIKKAANGDTFTIAFFVIIRLVV